MTTGKRGRGPGLRAGIAVAIVALAVASCSVIPASRFVERYSEPAPDPQNLVLCEGYACRFGAHVALSADEWAKIAATLQPAAPDAATERDHLARAVAKLDLIAAQHAGTAVEQRRDWINKGDPSQIDCVDHTVNTTTYLRLFERAGLLRWHRSGIAAHRGSVLAWDVANTATVVEIDTGRSYSIDTALGDPGVQPYVVPLEVWIEGPLPEFQHNPVLQQAAR